MGVCFPLSDIDRVLDSSTSTQLSCLFDTSFLVSASDKDHIFYDDASFFAEKIEEWDIAPFVSITARSEFIDYRRRVIITETLMDMLGPKSKWRVPQAILKELGTQKGWIDNQPRTGNEPILSDSRIKHCKQLFLPRTQSGHVGWVELCKEVLNGELLSSWEKISNTLSLNYIDMRSSDSKDLFDTELRWENMYHLAEQTALGSHDSMILNMFSSSKIEFLITMDFDLAYGAMASLPDSKIVFVHDNLYRNKLKKLRF